MAKYLIVNADDFGLCQSANEAVFDLFRQNKLLSSTIMMPCRFAKEAVQFSIDNPQYAIGIHTTLTSEWQRKEWRWKPLTNSPSLVDEDGFMWHESDQFAKHAKLREAENEIRAQIDAALEMGMKPSHIDNHMGSLYGHQTGRLTLPKMTLRVMGDYGYAYRFYTKTDKRICPRGVPYPVYAATTRLISAWAKKYNVITPDYLLFPDWTKDLVNGSYENYRDTILKIWTNIPDGVTETYIHPAIASDELKSITNMWWCRDAEYRLMSEDSTHEYLASHGVKMISYRDLIKMKSR